jgi:hypothetical protein
MWVSAHLRDVGDELEAAVAEVIGVMDEAVQEGPLLQRLQQRVVHGQAVAVPPGDLQHGQQHRVTQTRDHSSSKPGATGLNANRSSSSPKLAKHWRIRGV